MDLTGYDSIFHIKYSKVPVNWVRGCRMVEIKCYSVHFCVILGNARDKKTFKQPLKH